MIYKSIIIKDTLFSVEVEYKRIKNIYLRVKDNTIKVTSSKYVTDYDINRFIDSKKDWIYKTNLKLNNNKELSYKYRKDDNHIYIYGCLYSIKYIPSKRNKLVFNKEGFTLFYSNEDYLSYLYKQLDKVLFVKINEKVNKYSDLLLNNGYFMQPVIKLRRLESKWGKCLTKENIVKFSSYLIHYPECCLDYLVVHELSHFIVPNHSSDFYNLVSKYCEDYKNISKMLI